MTLECSQFSLVENLSKKNPLQDLLSILTAAISTNETTEFIIGLVIYNQAYTYKFKLKTTIICYWSKLDISFKEVFGVQQMEESYFLPKCFSKFL